MFNFIGCGSAFHTTLGNNGAYLKKDQTLYMIDCGSSTFHRLVAHNLLEDVKRIDILMTHTHPDHIGSLGDLIFYSYFKLNPAFTPKVTVIAPKPLLEEVKVIASKMGVEDLQVSWQEVSTSSMFETFTINPVSVQHAETLTCFGYEFIKGNERYYYSGDANAIPDFILKQLLKGNYNLFFQDTSGADYEGNVHLSLRELNELIPPSYRATVCCMHLDEAFPIEEARKSGYQLAIDSLIK